MDNKKRLVIVFIFVFSLLVFKHLSVVFSEEENLNILKEISTFKKEKIESLFANKGRIEGVTIRALKDEDLDGSFVAQSDSINEVQFYIHVENNTKNNLSLLQVPTGIKEGTLNYIRVEGTSGYFWEGGELVLAYLSLLPGEVATLTITGLPMISPDSISLNISPLVKDSDLNILAKGPSIKKVIAGKTFSFKDKFMSSVKRVQKEKDLSKEAPEPSINAESNEE